MFMGQVADEVTCLFFCPLSVGQWSVAALSPVALKIKGYYLTMLSINA
jgi:hypothetical protein